MIERKDVVEFGEEKVTLLGNVLNVGDYAPNFRVLKNDLSDFNLSEYDGKIKVISVVPSVDTGICALQTKRFNQEASKIKNVEIITISCDLPFALKRFCAGEGIENLITVSDHYDTDFGLKYGLLIKEKRLLARAILVIDANNVIRYFKINPQIKTEVNFDEVLKLIENI